MSLRNHFHYSSRRGVVEDEEIRALAASISCASGYADLPPGLPSIEEGLFRALLDCRVVLRTIRSLSAYLGLGDDDSLDSIALEYDGTANDIQGIPRVTSARALAHWAESQEKRIYAELDAFAGRSNASLPSSQRFESVLWLQSVRFLHSGLPVASNRILMIDDVHRLRRRQRELLIDELTIQRPAIPVWLAMRTLVLGDTLLSQGARAGRDISVYSLEELWGKTIHQFMSFAQNILDRRMNRQDAVSGTFSQHLREQFDAAEVRPFVQSGIERFRNAMRRHENNERYREWLSRASKKSTEPSLDMLIELVVTRILVARDASKKQLSFDLALPAQEIDEKDNSSIRGAAEIQLHEELGLPYFYGLERLCVMATYNVEELLALAAALYDGIVAGQVLRRRSPELSPAEQERILQDSAGQRLKFVPKQHTEGARAKRLIESIGGYCRERTFLPNAPYAPGVTGVRLSELEMEKLRSSPNSLGDQGSLLKKVLSECIAENLLALRPSSATTGRDPGSTLYLNRTLCAHFGLPLQMGGWQDVTCIDLVDWMLRGWVPQKRLSVET